jgi:hypothetical protein
VRASIFRRFACLGLGLLLAVSGCGGGSGETTTPQAPRLTKVKLVEKLGKICQAHSDEQVVAIEEFDKKHGIPHGIHHEKATGAQLEEELVQVMLPIVRDTIRDLEELRPPREQEADFKAFLEALEHGVAYSRRDPSWIVDAKPEPFSRARELSWKLGTPLCGQA